MTDYSCRLAFVGRIRIDRKFICAEPDMALHVLSQGIVVKADTDLYADCIEYIMFAPQLFREILEGQSVPLYDLTIGVTDEGDIEIVAEEQL
jgi:hypothetical protein